MSGWDIKKALQLLYKSNPSLLEWLNSPIKYIETPYVDEIREAMAIYFNRRNSLFHYVNMADNNYKLLRKEGEFVTLKKYFYCIRPILCCKWILAYNTTPPVRFTDMTYLLEDDIKDLMDKFILIKKEQKETNAIETVDILNSYIEKNMIAIRENLLNMHEGVNNYDRLNELYIKALKEYGGISV